MICRFAAFSLMGALAACHPPAPEVVPIPVVAIQASPTLSAEQVRERSDLCATASSEQFQREWKGSAVATDAGTTTADFASHYNTKMNICFYLVTIRHLLPVDEHGLAHPGRVRKFLFDFGAGEQYGEYDGPIVASGRAHRITSRCKIEELFCFSEAEWNTIARSYMEE